jgi:hypothetical protein
MSKKEKKPEPVKRIKKHEVSRQERISLLASYPNLVSSSAEDRSKYLNQGIAEAANGRTT